MIARTIDKGDLVRVRIAASLAVAVVALVAGCYAPFEDEQVVTLPVTEQYTLSGKGSLTLSVYDQYGRLAIQNKSQSVEVQSEGRDEIIVQSDSTVTFVKTSMVLAEDGLIDITASLPAGTPLDNPFDLYRTQQPLWGGATKSIVLYPFGGASPIKVYGGTKIETFDTSRLGLTQLRVDGKRLWFYACSYLLLDNNSLLPK